MVTDIERLEEIGKELLLAIGQNPNSESLRETPHRFAKMWTEFIDYKADNADKTFPELRINQLVVVKDMPIWSMCEHHLLPFQATISAGYIAAGRLLGLSKIGRIVKLSAHRLQMQERLVNDIADHIEKATGSLSVAVLASGTHTCMAMRGIEMPHKMISSEMRGAFRDEPEARAEFFQVINHG